MWVLMRAGDSLLDKRTETSKGWWCPLNTYSAEQFLYLISCNNYNSTRNTT